MTDENMEPLVQGSAAIVTVGNQQWAFLLDVNGDPGLCNYKQAQVIAQAIEADGVTGFRLPVVTELAALRSARLNELSYGQIPMAVFGRFWTGDTMRVAGSDEPVYFDVAFGSASTQVPEAHAFLAVVKDTVLRRD